MKTTLKIFSLIIIVTTTILSCSTMPLDLQPTESEPNINPRPDDSYNLHQYIRPTKPIKVPDTMAITGVKPSIYNAPQDSIPLDSIPQDSTQTNP